MGKKSIQKLCDWQVYALAMNAVDMVKNRWRELGYQWNVPDDAYLAKLLVAQAFQESAIDKSGPPYCGFDPAAGAGITSATGLMQFVGKTWYDIQKRILKLPLAQQRELDARKDAAFCMYCGCAYLVHMFDYKKTYSWKRALRRYHDGYAENHKDGPGYVNVILNEWFPLFDFERLAAQIVENALEISGLVFESRKEFK